MNLLVLSGGRHPYAESTPILEEFLKAAGHDPHVTEDASILASDNMREFDALVFNTRREGDMLLARDEQIGLTRFVGGGKGFVCIHISGCRPAEWPEFHDVTGGGWITGTSFHPPYGQFNVNVKNAKHPCAKGISDFMTNDELYMGIAVKPGNDVFLTGDAKDGTFMWGGKETFMPGGTFALAWTRVYGSGKVFKTTLGHNGLSFQTPQFQKLILNGVEWVTSKG
ncbi:MAG: ThuA domain-containing protein [Chloroflexi bacterium]|nr:ThuA domain-containing protein [Chloroflexota bacterium]